MPTRIKLVKQRLAMVKLIVNLMRVTSIEYLGTKKVGSSGDTALLVCAIFIGQAERRPMTANKLAEYIGMPRPTVVRKLRALQNGGMVFLDGDGAATLSLDKLNSPEMVGVIEAAIRAVHKTSAELSKMDSKVIAKKVPAT